MATPCAFNLKVIEKDIEELLEMHERELTTDELKEFFHKRREET